MIPGPEADRAERLRTGTPRWTGHRPYLLARRLGLLLKMDRHEEAGRLAAEVAAQPASRFPWTAIVAVDVALQRTAAAISLLERLLPDVPQDSFEDLVHQQLLLAWQTGATDPLLADSVPPALRAVRLKAIAIARKVLDRFVEGVRLWYQAPSSRVGRLEFVEDDRRLLAHDGSRIWSLPLDRWRDADPDMLPVRAHDPEDVRAIDPGTTWDVDGTTWRIHQASSAEIGVRRTGASGLLTLPRGRLFRESPEVLWFVSPRGGIYRIDLTKAAPGPEVER